MARKKRRFQETEIPAEEPQKKKVYRDSFQQNIGRKLEDVGKKMEGKGKNVLYAIAAVAVLVALIGIYYAWNRRNNAAAQAALGKAIEISQAQVTDTPPAGGTTGKTFKTEKERAEAAISEFQTVVDKFGGSHEEKAKYFIAVNKLKLDRAAAIAELEALAATGGEVGELSKFALAQAKADDGKPDEAIAIYNELLRKDDLIIAKDTINYEIANIYQRQNKNQEAADLYFSIAQNASIAKDLEGKPIPMTETARKAKEKLQEIDPERAKAIQEPKSDTDARTFTF